MFLLVCLCQGHIWKNSFVLENDLAWKHRDIAFNLKNSALALHESSHSYYIFQKKKKTVLLLSSRQTCFSFLYILNNHHYFNSFFLTTRRIIYHYVLLFVSVKSLKNPQKPFNSRKVFSSFCETLRHQRRYFKGIEVWLDYLNIQILCQLFLQLDHWRLTIKLD